MAANGSGYGEKGACRRPAEMDEGPSGAAGDLGGSAPSLWLRVRNRKGCFCSPARGRGGLGVSPVDKGGGIAADGYRKGLLEGALSCTRSRNTTGRSKEARNKLKQAIEIPVEHICKGSVFSLVCK